jgi:tRNA A58 N-methylase Trm61
MNSRTRFQQGDLALLIDRKRRRYLLTLNEESTFHTHVGTLPHEGVAGGSGVFSGWERFFTELS